MRPNLVVGTRWKDSFARNDEPPAIHLEKISTLEYYTVRRKSPRSGKLEYGFYVLHLLKGHTTNAFERNTV